MVERLEELREETRLDTVLLTSDWRGMDHELRMQSLRRIGEEVLPRLRHDASPAPSVAGPRR